MNSKFEVLDSDEGKRLDIFISEKLNTTRAKAQELIKNGVVKVNNIIKPKSYRLKSKEVVEIKNFTITSKQPEVLIPQNIPINILYRDDYLIVVSKPPNMVVYPSLGHKDGTLMNALSYHVKKLANIGGPLRPGVVHRLDKDTSGVIVIALDDQAYYGLVELFKKRQVKKEYIAIVYGQLKGSGTITAPIGRAKKDRKKMSIKSKKAKEAITVWEVIKNFKNYSLLKIKIITGRTHQIRVHFSSIGHPVLGDKTYGKKLYIEIGKRKIPVQRQMLHAFKIEFIHPITGQLLQLEAPLPDDMKEVINILSEEV